MGLPRSIPPVFALPDPSEPIQERSDSSRPELAWSILGEIGFVLAIVGAADLLLIWYPFAFQSPEWEFGTVTATLDGLPVLAVGLGMVLASGLHAGSRWRVRSAVVLFALLGLCLLAAGLLYATVLPMALRSISDPMLETGLHRAILKTTVQAIAYPLVFLWIAFKSWY